MLSTLENPFSLGNMPSTHGSATLPLESNSPFYVTEGDYLKVYQSIRGYNLVKKGDYAWHMGLKCYFVVNEISLVNNRFVFSGRLLEGGRYVSAVGYSTAAILKNRALLQSSVGPIRRQYLKKIKN